LIPKRDDFRIYESNKEFYTSVAEVIEKLKTAGFSKEADWIDEAYRYPGSTGGEIIPRIFAACREQKRQPRLNQELRKHLAEIIYNVILMNLRPSLQGDELDY
jgi:hypothetical protein